MRNKVMAAIVVTGIAAHAIFGGLPAVGSIRQPSSVSAEPFGPVAPAAPSAESPEKRASVIQKLRQRWAKFRPVNRGDQAGWDRAGAVLSSKSTIDKIFDKEMSLKLQSRYQGAVLPFEREVTNPVRWASPWENRRYEQSRKDLAEWTVKEVGKHQLKDFIRRQKSESGALSVAASASGVQDDEKKASPRASAFAADGTLIPQEEEIIPTRLRAKLNLLKTRGQLTFSNPVVTTSVEAKAGSGENLAVELNRDFRQLEMISKVRYGVDESLLILNVNKRITDEVSVDLNSERWTGSKRGSVGEKSKDTAKVLYSVSF
jgi:hypothetical protein